MTNHPNRSKQMQKTPAEWRAMAQQVRREASSVFAAGDPDGRGSDMLAQALDMERTATAMEAAAAQRQ